MCPPVQQPATMQMCPPVQPYGAPTTPPAPAYRVPVSTPPPPPAPTSRRSVSFAAAPFPMCAPCDVEGDMLVLSDLEHFAADSDEENSGDLDAVSKSTDTPFITKKGRQLTDHSAVVRRALSFLLNDDE